MAIDIDRSEATKLLNDSYLSCTKTLVNECCIKSCIDFVMQGKNCLTYRYIMFTALLAKAVDESVDILSLQAGDHSAGAYDARSLASKVVFQFQKTMLGNILDGANSDPLVNKPGRFLRLSKSNPAAGGDPQKALNILCDNLPNVQPSKESKKCVNYIISKLIIERNHRNSQQKHFDDSANNMGIFHVHEFLSKLLDQGFGGAALVLVTTALYHLQYAEESYRICAHPVNQAGTSGRQFSDLDVFRDSLPFLGTELKDKPFTASDVDHAAETAFRAGVPGLLFVAGRQSDFASQPPTYFSNAREKYARKGMYVGVTSVDSLMDIVLASHMDVNTTHLMGVIRKTSEEIGALEAQMWIYKYMEEGHQEIE